MDALWRFREMQVKIQIPSSPWLVAGLLPTASKPGLHEDSVCKSHLPVRK